MTVASGHMDGGVKFWDLRSKERTAEYSNVHSGTVTSIHFNPRNNSEMITMGRDCTIKLVDVRTGQELQAFHHGNFRVDTNYSACTISPDGKNRRIMKIIVFLV